MPKPLQVLKLIDNSLMQKIPVMLLFVLESRGSSPGRQGFLMAVNAKGEMEGSIGGGIMEHKFVEMAKKKLQENDQTPFIKKQFHDKNAETNQSGMICSGEQTILSYPVKEKDSDIIRQVIHSMESNQNGTLVLSPEGPGFSKTAPAKDFEFIYTSETSWKYTEKTGAKNQLFIIGGGHCALALSKLMRDMDFSITIFEDRKELPTIAKNQYAHEIIFVEDYTALDKLIPAGSNQYVVIMTFGYRTDDMALRSLLQKQFAYIGVLGSSTKMEKLFSTYRNEGADETLLQRINSPAGLDISSRTPEEIAVSIAARIIQVKNRV